jgi:choline dehydrogenase
VGTGTITPRPATYDADYIVVGSGAGGGTVAARLAESGFRVLLLEAGGDPRTTIGSTPQTPGINSLPDDYDVPGFHPLSAENDGIRWDFFVRHYEDQARQEKDQKYRSTFDGKPVNGVLYPRAGTLGGCTAHNAMILVYPHNADWNQLADLTGDPTWRAENMRSYFERLERCEHRSDEPKDSRPGHNPSRHGWSGWLQTEVAMALAVFKDKNFRKMFIDTAKAVLRSPEVAITDQDRRARLDSELDPNDWRVVTEDAIGLRYTPLTTKDHRRVGTRERVLEVANRPQSTLKIQMHALVTRVLLDSEKRAIGVEYQSGERLYGAHPRQNTAAGKTKQVFAAREVILAGGTFNTPQVLMLSGIGPRDVIEKHGLTCVEELSGVGKNLQDRYEVAVVNRMKFPAWKALEGATFTRADSQYKDWADYKNSIYDSNGAVLSVIARSGPAAFSPDLFLYSVIGRFEGYFPGYSSLLAQNPNCLTWIILKGHTNNTGGEVTLASKDPRVPPSINFHYFDEGTDARKQDLKAVATGVALARKLSAGLKQEGMIEKEETPGDDVTDDKLLEFIKNQAWGHHAAGTCRIGRREDGGVLSTNFEVHGIKGLRVVDASVFPRLPGFFLVSSVYMIGEKAADVIAATARQTAALGPVKPIAP